MEITILGNGGCINVGLPYNAFILNNDFLVELPPDIMLSINREKFDITQIKNIFVSHLHGDHFFGLPFLIISAFIEVLKNKKECNFTIYGPQGIKEASFDLLDKAFARKHPCYKWMEDNVLFVGINENCEFSYGEHTVEMIKMEHMFETYGFVMRNKDQKIDFVYFADTVWCESIDKTLAEKPLHVLADMNDSPGIHLGSKDFEEFALKITGNATKYYGIHLNSPFESSNENIICSYPGMKINI